MRAELRDRKREVARAREQLLSKVPRPPKAKSKPHRRRGYFIPSDMWKAMHAHKDRVREAAVGRRGDVIADLVPGVRP